MDTAPFTVLLILALGIAGVAVPHFFFVSPPPLECELRPDGVFLTRIGWTIPWQDIDQVTTTSDWHVADLSWPPFIWALPGKLVVSLQVRNGFVIRVAFLPRWLALMILDVSSLRAGEVRLRPARGARDVTPLAQHIEQAVARARLNQP